VQYQGGTAGKIVRGARRASWVPWLMAAFGAFGRVRCSDRCAAEPAHPRTAHTASVSLHPRITILPIPAAQWSAYCVTSPKRLQAVCYNAEIAVELPVSFERLAGWLRGW